MPPRLMTRLLLEDEVFHDRYPAYRNEVVEATNHFFGHKSPERNPDALIDYIVTRSPMPLLMSLCKELRLTGRNYTDLIKKSKQEVLRYVEGAINFSSEIETMQIEELIKRFESIDRSRIEKQNELGNERDKMQWFSQSKCDLEPALYGTRKSFSIDEAVAISFGKDPLQVNTKTLGPLNAVQKSPFKIAYDKRLRSLSNHAQAKNIDDFVDKSVFLDWCHVQRLPIALTKSDREKELHGSTQNSLYLIIIGLAQQCSDFDLWRGFDEQRDCVDQVHAALENAKVSIDKVSVSKHLRNIHAWARASGSKRSGFERGAKKEKSLK